MGMCLPEPDLKLLLKRGKWTKVLFLVFIEKFAHGFFQNLGEGEGGGWVYMGGQSWIIIKKGLVTTNSSLQK